jgi:hypothetical protein
MQGMKSATTYAKRIGIESLTGIAPDDDDGNGAAKSVSDSQQALGEAVHALSSSIKVIKKGIATDDLSTASEAWFELNDKEKASIWVATTKGGPFTTQERTTMQSQEFRLANRNFAEAKPTGMFQGAKQ